MFCFRVMVVTPTKSTPDHQKLLRLNIHSLFFITDPKQSDVEVSLVNYQLHTLHRNLVKTVIKDVSLYLSNTMDQYVEYQLSISYHWEHKIDTSITRLKDVLQEKLVISITSFKMNLYIYMCVSTSQINRHKLVA